MRLNLIVLLFFYLEYFLLSHLIKVEIFIMANLQQPSRSKQAARQATTTLASVDIYNVGEATAVLGGNTSIMVARPGKICCAFPLFWFTFPKDSTPSLLVTEPMRSTPTPRGRNPRSG